MENLRVLLLALTLVLGAMTSWSQNLYPASGNVKVFATDENWSEGFSVIKSSGWSGIRINRSNPTGGNYNGNWAIGHTAYSNDDLSIVTNYGGTQYNSVFHLSNSTRNIGIGTSTPLAKLNVVGGPIEISGYSHQADASLHISTAYGQWDRLTQINPSLPSKPGLNLMASTDANTTYNWWAWGVLSSGAWALQPSTSFGGSTGLFIDRNGNVGVGSSSPNQKLTVNGTIYGKEVKVDLSVPGPDYVFEESYTLPKLEEVKLYIDQNKHLPEVPSAKEMEKNGVNLGEMNMLLLKKVEELTLYMLTLQRKNEELEGRLNSIERKK